MAATTNWTDGSISGVDKPHSTTPRGDIFVLRNIIDCSKTTLDAGNADVAQVISIPAETIVWYAMVRIITAETASGTVDLGYGGSAGTVNIWGNALALDTTANTMLTAIVDKPVYFATAYTIDLVATTDTADVNIDGAKIEVIAFCTDSGSTIDIGG